MPIKADASQFALGDALGDLVPRLAAVGGFEDAAAGAVHLAG